MSTAVAETNKPRNNVVEQILADPKLIAAFKFLNQNNPNEIEFLETELGKLTAEEYTRMILGGEMSKSAEMLPYPTAEIVTPTEIIRLISDYESLAGSITDNPTEQDIDTLIDLAVRIDTASDQYKSKRLEWRSEGASKLGLHLGGLIIHDLYNYTSVITGYTKIMDYKSEFPSNDSQARAYLDRTIPFLKMVRNFYEVLEMAESGKPFEVDGQKMLDTLYLHADDKIVMSNDIKFSSLEEFLVVRTHVWNALQFSSKTPNQGPITITRSENNDNETLDYSIKDDFSNLWPLELILKAREAYEHGFNCPDLPLVASKGGMVMSAFLAGQRAAKSGSKLSQSLYNPWLLNRQDPESKTVVLRFALDKAA